MQRPESRESPRDAKIASWNLRFVHHDRRGKGSSAPADGQVPVGHGAQFLIHRRDQLVDGAVPARCAIR
jgi:hypothetical protein